MHAALPRRYFVRWKACVVMCGSLASSFTSMPSSLSSWSGMMCLLRQSSQHRSLIGHSTC